MSAIYRKGEVLGWGTVAAVYAGWDELLDRPVAIKELRQPFAGNEPFSRAFRNQALRLLDLSHRHVLATWAVDSDRNVHSVIREAAEETVGQKSFHGPMDPEEVLKILRATLLGLDALHSRNFIHRAVRPENIFLCGGVYKIGDFGLPAIEGAPPLPPRRYRYSAPEEIKMPDLVSRESDLYSLGFVAYELILGPLRFEKVVEELLREAGLLPESGGAGESRENLWPRFHASPLELPPLLDLEPGIPAAFSLALQKMVAKDPSARYATCRQALASMGTGVPELATGSQTLTIVRETTPASGGGNWVWIAGGALVTSAILASTIWVLALRQPKAQPVSFASPQESSPLLETNPASQTKSPLRDPASRLIGLVSKQSGVAVSLDPPHSETRPRLPLATPLRFRITSDKAGYLLLFTVSSDGSIACLYPNPIRPTLTIGRDEQLTLPSPKDAQEGITLYTDLPLGRQLVFLLHSPHPLPPLPASQGESQAEYTSQGKPRDPASRFVDWLSKLREDHPDMRLVGLDFEVEAAR